jgi:hypothetical protein
MSSDPSKSNHHNGSSNHLSPTLGFPSSPLLKKPSISSPTPKNNIGTLPYKIFSILFFLVLDLKIIILGNGGVGKTSFIYRYMNDNFAETISVPKEKPLPISNFS